MTSLSAHFVQSDDHDRLTFHPACPRCRSERLEGRLNDDLGVPLRAQAAITAGVLAFTAVAPSAAFATDGDVEGTAPPGQVAPDMDSEGELDAADEATSPPTEVPDAAGGPVEEQAPDAPEPEVVDSTDPEAEAEEPVTEEPEPPESEPAPATPVPEAAPTSAPAAPAAATSTSREASRAHAKAKREVKREIRRARQKARAASSRTKQTPPTQAAPAPATPAPATARTAAPAPPPQPVAAVAASTVQQRDPAKPGDRTHTVQRGESLWSIAADVLGDDASPARIAREVNRLWELNKSRIGTGDRNLVHAGTKLRLA